MKPLLFLSARSFVNGVKRAFTSGRRIIGLLVVVGYYVNLLFRGTGGDASPLPPGVRHGPIEFRPEVLQACAFTVFTALSFFLLINSFNPRGGFRQADVDVLFPTPVSPKVVLIFRIFRDYVVTLFIPLFVAIVAGRSAGPGLLMLLNHFPEEGRIVTRLFTITYLLMTLCWVTIGYAMSLFVNRSDLQSDRNKKIIGGTIAAFLLASVLYVAIRLRADLSWDTAMSLTDSPFLRTVFFTATAATSVIMAPFDNSFVEGAAGVLAMLAIIGLSIRIAMTQIGYLYDQAAAKGFHSQNMRNLQRSGDTYGVMAAQANEGKVRGGWFTRIVGKWKFKRAGALVWKELLLHGRTGLWQYGAFGPLILFIVLMPVWVAGKMPTSEPPEPSFFGALAFGVFLLSVSNAQSGFIELLRRVDLQKPLPFSPVVTVFWEVAAKAAPTVVIATIAGIGAMILNIHLWPAAVAGMIMAPSLSLVLASVALLVMVLFPDVDDAAQRGFRGLMMLLGIAIAAAPGIGLAVVMIIFHVPSVVMAIPFLLINLAVAAGISAVSGGLYSSYNPSE